MGQQSQNESSTIPLGRGGKRGPHGTSSLSMRRFSHSDDVDLDDEYEIKGKLRFQNLRSSILKATSPGRLPDATKITATTKTKVRKHWMPHSNSSTNPSVRMRLMSSKRRSSKSQNVPYPIISKKVVPKQRISSARFDLEASSSSSSSQIVTVAVRSGAKATRGPRKQNWNQPADDDGG